MCAARHCPQFATCRQQLTRQHVGSPVNASVFWTVAIPTWSQNIKWRRYFKCQMHADVGKLKVQPQVCKVIPRAAPSVEVLSPKCNAPEIPKSFKASTLQGFFSKATTDGFRKNQTFTSCNWGPNILNENTKKLFFLMFFHACQRRNIRLMTLSGCNKMQSSNCSCCETPFQWNLAFFTLFYMFQLSSIPSLPKSNLSSCVCDFSAVTFSYLFYVCSPWQLKIKLFYPCHDRVWHLVTSWYFEMFTFDENIYTSNHHFCCSKLQGSEKYRKMKSVLAPWLEYHGVAPNPWLAAMFPVPSRFLSI